MTDPKDPDATELGDGAASGPDEATGEYTEYEGAGAGTSTGFDKARTLAAKAGAESGRLLKKRFVLEDELGRGGMGIVYKARDLRKVEADDSNPYIAAKVLGQSFKEHPHAFVALQQEAVKSQKLAHPNIVTVHDFDREGNTIFMTMELLKGDPLDSLLKLEAPFSKEVSVRYFNEMCAGLEYAHKRELIHSDFKPGNVFVTTGGTVKVLDFGIARAVNMDRQSNDFDAGELGALTPAYATVEMIRREPPSFSDDVYALACVFYYMLTGKHPYQGLSAADAMEQAVTPEKPPPLNAREWAALSRGLATKKSERFATVAEFREAFNPPARSTNLKLIVPLVLLVIAAGAFLGYRGLQVPAAQEEALAERLSAAQNCMIERDYVCAIDNARVVLSLSQGHAEASKLLQLAEEARTQEEQVGRLETMLRAARDCLAASDYGCVRIRVGEALALDPDNIGAAALLEQAEKTERAAGVAAYIARAEACLADGDAQCARRVLDEAADNAIPEAELYATRKQVDELAARQAREQQERQSAIAALLSAGRECLESNRLDCAATKADEVLASFPGNAEAVALQEAVAARRAARVRTAKLAAGLVDEARLCFGRKDYSCAIAKADSALALDEGSAAARDLKARAQKAQGSVKKSIIIR
ncbi:MAG: protein kinase [Halioglobus sp.]|nr:protein kinase [Halioglobus sp.]